MSATKFFTALLAAGAALAKPVAWPEAEAATTIDLGSGIPTSSGLTITSVSYAGDGCKKGTLDGIFCPETSSFNVTMKALKAILKDGKHTDDANCHIQVGIKTEYKTQLNLLQGDFHGSVYLQQKGMTALAHSTVSFIGSQAISNIPFMWVGPCHAKSSYEHNVLATLSSQCSGGGDFLMLIDLYLQVTRGSADDTATGFVDIDELTGAISHAYILQPSPCGQAIGGGAPSSLTSSSGGDYGTEEAAKKKATEKSSAELAQTGETGDETNGGKKAAGTTGGETKDTGTTGDNKDTGTTGDNKDTGTTGDKKGAELAQTGETGDETNGDKKAAGTTGGETKDTGITGQKKEADSTTGANTAGGSQAMNCGTEEQCKSAQLRTRMMQAG